MRTSEFCRAAPGKIFKGVGKRPAVITVREVNNMVRTRFLFTDIAQRLELGLIEGYLWLGSVLS